MKINKLASAAIFSLIASTSSSVLADQYLDSVTSQINTYTQQLSSEGWTFHSMVAGKLGENDEESWTSQLDSGRSFRLVGVCDQDCSDIDLSISSSNGKLIDEDVLEDDYPIVDVYNANGDRYTWEASMYECSAEPCYYAVAVYIK